MSASIPEVVPQRHARHRPCDHARREARGKGRRRAFQICVLRLNSEEAAAGLLPRALMVMACAARCCLFKEMPHLPVQSALQDTSRDLPYIDITFNSRCSHC